MNLRATVLLSLAAFGLTLVAAHAQPAPAAKGVVLGLNNTKKDPVVPLAAELEAANTQPASTPASATLDKASPKARK
jgi:hypothetical protein